MSEYCPTCGAWHDKGTADCRIEALPSVREVRFCMVCGRYHEPISTTACPTFIHRKPRLTIPDHREARLT